MGKDEIKAVIFNHPEFTAFSRAMEAVFGEWKTASAEALKALDAGLRPKDEIRAMAERLLQAYRDRHLIDPYDVYQHVMEYWADTMQDDLYELAADGWKAGSEVKRLEKKTKKGGKEVAKPIPGIEGLEGTLIPPALIIQEYCADQQHAIDDLHARVESLNAEMEELREEHGSEDGLLSNAVDDKGNISKGNLQKALKAVGKRTADNADEYDLLRAYKKLMDDEANAKSAIKKANAELEILVIKQYPALSLDDIKTLVVDKKWMPAIEQRIRAELDNISHRLTQRIKELADRYDAPLPELTKEVSVLTERVEAHLKRMGFIGA